MKSFFEFLQTNQNIILRALKQHLWMVSISVFIAVVVALPLGILLSSHKKAAKYVLYITGAIQTVPGLVMLSFARMALGIGTVPAVAVITVCAVLPILRNTYTGITEVDGSYIEAAEGLGMTGMQSLFEVKLPLSMPSIIAGFRMSAVYTVSWATLGGLIGAGGLGDLIWTGLSTYNKYYIYAGAIPAAILVVVISILINVLKRVLIPRGLRVGGATED